MDTAKIERLLANLPDEDSVIGAQNQAFCDFCEAAQPYSSFLHDYFWQNADYWNKKNFPWCITKKSAEKDNGFLQAIAVQAHECYHNLTLKKHAENYYKLPQAVRDKVGELDAKNWKIVEPMVFSGKHSQAEINAKYAELEGEDARRFPEIFKAVDDYDANKTLYFPYVGGRDFELKIMPSPDERGFCTALPDAVKGKTFEVYVAPESRAQMSPSFFYNYLEEFVTAFQTIHFEVESLGFVKDLNAANEGQKYVKVRGAAQDAFLNDLRILRWNFEHYAEYVYFLFAYLDYAKCVQNERGAQGAEFFKNLQDSKTELDLIKSVFAALIGLRQRFEHFLQAEGVAHSALQSGYSNQPFADFLRGERLFAWFETLGLGADVLRVFAFD